MVASSKKSVLLVSPSMQQVYEDAKIKGAVPHYPPLNLLTIAGSLLRAGHQASLIDFDVLGLENQDELLHKKLDDVKPDIVGFTFTSPIFSQAKGMINVVREFDKDIQVIAGGSHPSADPEGTLRESDIDVVIVGEGDFTILEIIEAKKLSDVQGIGFKNGKKIVLTKRRPFIKDLDKLPLPAMELVDLGDYHVPRSVARKQPAAMMETSRGCAWGCTYCTKAVFGRNFRFKSPQRVVDEFKHFIDAGVEEIHIMDDMFTTSKDRTKEICRLLVEQGVDVSWVCQNGIRADMTDEELVQAMYDAGCYRVNMGVESGNQQILNNIDKGLTLEQTRAAFKAINKVGMEVIAYLILGMPGETEETMQQTIEFAKEIKPTIAKFDILVPLPSTPLYHEWKDAYFKVSDWDNFNFHSASELYTHPNLSWEVLERYYNKAYREFYFRPSYLVQYLIRSIRQGTILDDIKLALSTKWF